MTPAARKHIDNGIWLCSHCATKIDKEPESYPVDLLHEWKKEAELRIKKNSNSKLYTEQETEHKVHKALVQAMDFRNLANIETSFSTLAKAINTHFRTLDPRLDISYSFSNNASHFEINIDEKIEDPIFIDFTPNNSFEYKEKISNLFEHGEGFSCSIEKVTTTSDGLNQLFPQNLKDGILKVLSPYKKESTIEFTDDWGNILLSLDGITTCGRSSFSIFAQKYDELINLSAEKIYYSGISNSNNFNLSLNFDKWDNKELSLLNYFDQIYKFYTSLSQIENLHMNVYIEGLEVFSSKTKLDKSFLSNLLPLLSYTYYCRLISIVLKQKILFKSEITFTAEEHQWAEKVSRLIKNIETKKDASCTITLFSNEQLSTIFRKEGTEITIEQENFIQLDNIFNCEINKTIYIKHTFINPKISVIKDTLPNKGEYKLKIENNNQGTYRRTTALSPQFPPQE